ncbi:TPA: hypothetical protein EYP70_07460 [Candidatus Bathyarchaeota archaeon]|nr:hypothetical protein [Candidatus Bathyarchaeota archaeon]
MILLRCACRGISPLLATVILIAITVAAGITIYHFFFTAVSVASSTLSIQIVSIDLLKSGGVTVFAVSIKNVGNVPISTCIVTVYGDSGNASITLLNIDPGGIESNTVLNPIGFEVTAGRAYPVKVTVTASDGSMLDKSLTVICSA